MWREGGREEMKKGSGGKENGVCSTGDRQADDFH